MTQILNRPRLAEIGQLDRGLVWDIDIDRDFGSTLPDRSLRKQHVPGITGPTFTPTRYGMSLDFDGSSDFIDILNYNALPLVTEPGTIEMYFRIDGLGAANKYVFTARADSQNNRNYILFRGSTLSVSVRISHAGTHDQDTGISFSEGEFCHIIYNWDGSSNVEYRVNGKVGNSLSFASGVSNAYDWSYLGKHDNNTYGPMKLILFRCWSRMLSTREMEQLYLIATGAASGVRPITLPYYLVVPEVVTGPQVSEADAVTVGESVTVDPLVLPDLSESEDVTVGEAVSVDLPITVSESEAVTVGESVTVTVSDPQVSEVEAITVGESVGSVASDPQITASEDVTVGEDVTVSIPVVADLSIDIEENLTVGDSASALVSDLPISETEAVTVGESADLDVDLTINETDAVTVGEAQTVTVSDPQISEVEAVTVGEAQTVQVLAEGELAITVSENITVGESTTVTAPTVVAAGGDWGPKTRKRVREKYKPEPIDKQPARSVRMAQEFNRRQQERIEQQKRAEEQQRERERHEEKVQAELERMKREEEEKARKRAIAMINLRKAREALEEKRKKKK